MLSRILDILLWPLDRRIEVVVRRMDADVWEESFWGEPEPPMESDSPLLTAEAVEPALQKSLGAKLNP